MRPKHGWSTSPRPAGALAVLRPVARAVRGPGTCAADDLAPGDRALAARDWSDLRGAPRARRRDDPDFALAYERLWSEFGGRGEMERRAVIARAARLGPDAAGRRGARSPTSCSCCAAAARSRRCATTPRWCASTRAVGPRRARSSCISRTRWSSRRSAAPGSRRWLRALPLQARARAARARRGAQPGRADRARRGDGAARPERRRAHGAACAPTSAPASARSIPPRRRTRSPTSAPPEVAGAATRPSRCRSRSCCGASGASARPRCPAAEVAAVVERSTRSTACTCRPRRSTRCAPPRRAGPLAGRPSALLPPTA